jgi:hypothetical protein
MSNHRDLMRAIQDDAQRAGERDRLRLEARRASKPRRPRPDPGVPARPLARLLLRWVAAQRAGPLVQEPAKTPQPHKGRPRRHPVRVPPRPA